ncbi:MAG: aminopeptidase [Nitrospirae bacterium]|nr:aminopeptidase [Nitrospirota bacterium]
MDKAIEKLLNINMGIHPGERVLVFTDLMQEGRLEPKEMDRCRRLEKATGRVAELCTRITSTEFYKYEALPNNGYEPPEPVWRIAFGDKALEELRKRGLLGRLIMKKAVAGDVEKAYDILSHHVEDMVDVVIAMSNFSTSHTRFRHLLTKIKGTRYASMPLFDTEMFSGPMDVDWIKIAERTEYIANLITRAEAAIMRCPLGTDIRFGLSGRTGHADTGILTEKGCFGNLPAGEVYIAPVEGTSEGIMVLSWSTTRKLTPPVTITVKGGKVTDVKGDPEFTKYLTNVFRVSPEAVNIAELGIGTNDKASRPDNILEAEKILGTTHIALGDNTTFGGNTSANFHEDYVFFNPTLVLEYRDGRNETIIQEGRLTNPKS